MEKLSEKQIKYLEIVQRGNPLLTVSDDELDWVIDFMKNTIEKFNGIQETMYINFIYIRGLREKQRIQKEKEEIELFKQKEEIYLSRHTNIRDKIVINNIKKEMREKYLGGYMAGGRRKTKLKRK